MKTKTVSVLVVIVVVGLVSTGLFFFFTSRYHVFKGHTLTGPAQPVAHGEHAAGTATSRRTVLYYRNPMNPAITSPVPMKDSMGMDYVPVYEGGVGTEGGISISPERQQLVGIKTERVEKRKLVHEILTVGAIAYDPQLYVAQEEYLQALKTKESLDASSMAEQSSSLLEAAGRKLLLLGMGAQEIQALAARKQPQGNLYLPTNEDTVWVYMTIYEYESGLIKAGIPVEVEAVAFPGDIFNGKIIGMTPVFDPMTRSVQARAEVGNPENKLKPGMYVNVKINADLGEKLAVSKEAVIHTGRKTVVVVMNENNTFFSTDVRLGQEAEGYFEVLGGLEEGQTVITSGNFLIDSESRLQSAVSGEHAHGQ